MNILTSPLSSSSSLRLSHWQLAVLSPVLLLKQIIKIKVRKQSHKPHKARSRDIKSKKLKSFLLWIYCRWPVICSKQGAIWLSWGLWRKKILPEILEASESSKTYTICNSHLTFKYLQYIPSWNGNKYFDLVINLQNHIFENSISKFK